MSQSYRLKLSRPALKLKVATRIPAQLVAGTGVAITKASGVYTFDIDTTELEDIAEATANAAVAAAVGVDIQAYDADLVALAANSSDGLWTHTGAGTGSVRTITGTAAEITVTNGNGVSGNPTLSLPTALTFTGKTITGGTHTSPTLNTPTFTDPILGTPASGNLVNCTGLVETIAGNIGDFTLGRGLTNSTNEIRMRTGTVIGSLSATPYTNNTALTALIPLDDTVPTSSEGTQILTLSYTPIISTSTLRCRFRGTVSNGVADNVVASIFQGTTNIGSSMINVTGANTKHTFFIEAEYAPGSTSAQTITVRVGGGATDVYFNGGSAGRLLGGSQAATLVVEEIAP